MRPDYLDQSLSPVASRSNSRGAGYKDTRPALLKELGVTTLFIPRHTPRQKHAHALSSTHTCKPLSLSLSLCLFESLSLSLCQVRVSHSLILVLTHTRTRTPKQPAPARTLVEALSNPELMHILKLWQIRHPTDMPLCQVGRSELVELAYQNEVLLRYVSSSFRLPICLICEHAPTTAD